MLFRTLGLRHLMVTDCHNRCVGMITRQDLVPFHITERLQAKEGENEDAMDHILINERRGSEGGKVLPAITLHPLGEEDENITNNVEADGTLTSVNSWQAKPDTNNTQL